MAMLDDEDDDLEKVETEGSPDDVIVPADQAAADPQIMTMTGAPPAAAGPGGDPRMRRGFGGPPGGGPGGPPGRMGFGPGGGFLQQLFQRMQAAREARQGQRAERFQQFAGTPMGQQFMQSPFGQQIAQRHPEWMPQPATPAAAPAADGTQPAAPAAGGAPAGAEPPTAAAAANQQALQQQQAPAKPETEETTTTTKTKRPFRDRAAQQTPASPAGVQQPQPKPQQYPSFGRGANGMLQQALARRSGGGGGGNRMF